MGNINLYKIDDTKIQQCLDDLNASNLEEKATLRVEKVHNEVQHYFDTTLYLETPHQSSEQISWNWILHEFKQDLYYTFKAPKAVLLINETVGEIKKTMQLHLAVLTLE